MKVKIFPIKKSHHFKTINKTGNKFFTKNLIMICLPRKLIAKKDSINESNSNHFLEFSRLGITTSRNVSKLSVVRNLIKRRLKSAFMVLCKSSLIEKDRDYVIIARKEIVNSTFKSIIHDLELCTKKLK